MPAPVIALFLAAHGLIHASFLGRPPATAGGPEWPFSLAGSWALTPLGLDAAASRLVGLGLIAVVVAGYLLGAVAYLGIGPEAVFVPAVVVASVASLVLLAVFFHPWLVLGLAIDAVLLWAVLGNGWLPGGAG